MAEQEGLQGREIVCVGFADWETDVWTNQHHLMSRLARANRVLFVESLGLRRPQLAGRDVARIARRLRHGLAAPRARDGLWVLAPLVVPLQYRALRALNRRLLRAQVRRAARRLGIGRPILWSYVPQAEALIEALDPALVVYHCVDDVAAIAGVDVGSFHETERRFATQADLVLASAPALAARLRGYSSNVMDAPNVADTALFARALEPGGAAGADPAVTALPGPRVVFTGAIVATKLDMELIAAVARAHPGWSFALVGPIGVGDPSTDTSALRELPNVHLLGPRRYEQLPDVLRAGDAGWIPYVLNAVTESVFPMKVYEYLAAGLPVVATPLPALVDVAEVAKAPDAEGMGRLLGEAMATDSPEQRAERSRAAAAHSWDTRLQEIAAAVERLPSRP